MQVILANPRGFCAGVDRAIAIVEQALAQYGSADSGASLGDILGAALKQRDDKTEDKTEDKAETEKAEE